MSQDFYQKALRDFPSFASQIVPTTAAQKFVDVVTPNKRKVKMLSNHKVVAQNRRTLAVQPSTTVPVSLLNGGQLDFRLESGLVDTLDYCILEIDVLNASAAAAVLAPSQMLINRIDIYAQNGGCLIKQIYGHELYLENIYLSNQEFLNFAQVLGLNNQYQPLNVSIAANGVDTLYIPIWSPFYSTRLNLEGLTGQILIRVLFNTTALTMSSGTLVNTTNCLLMAKGRDLMNSIARSYVDAYRGPIPLQLNFMNIQRQTQVLQLAPSSTYSVVLSGIRGICSVFIFTIRSPAISGSNCINYVTVQNYDIQTSDGASMIGFMRRDYDNQLMDYAECFSNSMLLNQDINVVSFSNDPVCDFSNASNTGYQTFDSFQNLSFTTIPTLVAGPYTLDVCAFCHAAINIQNGVISVSS